MANRLSHLLKQWYEERDSTQWVLGTVYKTEGPCYRKAGAMMLFNGIGQQFGLLSGGCLESDIQKRARQVMQTGRATTLRYDGSDEDDLPFLLGIGCGGTVYILLQPICSEINYLGLGEVHRTLLGRCGGYFHQLIPCHTGEVQSRFVPAGSHPDFETPTPQMASLTEVAGRTWLVTPITPDLHLLVVGGGLDARPVVSIAHELGWQISLCDPRPANARREFFMSAGTILRHAGEELKNHVAARSVDAAILMSHNVQMDAEALCILQSSSLKYLALLGPDSRRKKVLAAADLTEEQLRTPLAGPAGLDIGAELPESIALSILAECHASLHRKQAHSLSGILPE